MSIRVKTFNGYLKAVFDIEDNNPINNENVKTFLYRGQGNKEWELLPAIARKSLSKNERKLFSQEQHLIETAKNRLPHIFERNLSPVDLLALMQHYGIPTRLLDVTTNPLVALYFACQNTETDGEVIIFQHDADDITDYSFANAIADSYRLIHLRTNTLQAFFDNASKQPYFFEEAIKVKKWPGIKNISMWVKYQCENKLNYVHAQELLERQRKQHGQFIICPNSIIEYRGNLEFEFEIGPINKNADFVRERIIIDKEGKEKILDRLNIIGINRGTLFGDSIDIVCEQITGEAKKRIMYDHANG